MPVNIDNPPTKIKYRMVLNPNPKMIGYIPYSVNKMPMIMRRLFGLSLVISQGDTFPQLLIALNNNKTFDAKEIKAKNQKNKESKKLTRLKYGVEILIPIPTIKEIKPADKNITVIRSYLTALLKFLKEDQDNARKNKKNE